MEEDQPNLDTIPTGNSPAKTDNIDNTHGSTINPESTNPSLQAALGPLVKGFQLLRESVDTVHDDYKDLKLTISMQKNELKQELSNKIEKNMQQLDKISSENILLWKEKNLLKTRIDAL